MRASPAALLNVPRRLRKSDFKDRGVLRYFYVGDTGLAFEYKIGVVSTLRACHDGTFFVKYGIYGRVALTLDAGHVQEQVKQDHAIVEAGVHADELDDSDDFGSPPPDLQNGDWTEIKNAVSGLIDDVENMDPARVLESHIRRKLASGAHALLLAKMNEKIREQKEKHEELVEKQRLETIALENKERDDRRKADDEARQKQERKRKEDDEKETKLLVKQKEDTEQQQAQQREAMEQLRKEQTATEEKAKKAREELAKKQAQTEASAEETALRKALADGQRKLLEDQQKLQQDTLALQQQTAREKLANAQLKLQIQQERENLIEDKNLDKINLDMQKQRLQTQSAADLTLRQKHAADFDRLQQEHDTKSAELAKRVQTLQDAVESAASNARLLETRQESLDERERLQNERERLQNLQQATLDAAAAPAGPLDGGAAAAASAAAAAAAAKAADASAAALAAASAEIVRLKQALAGSSDGGAAAAAAATTAAAAAAAASAAALAAADQAAEIRRLQRELRAERDKVRDALWDFANLEKEADGLYDRLGGRPAPAGPPVDPTQEFSYRKYHGGFDYGDWIAAMDALCLFRDTDRSYALFHMDWQTVLHENGLLLAKIAARAVPFGTWELSRAFFKANEGSCRLTPLWNNLYFQFGLITQRLTEENLRPWVTGERERLIGWCRTVCTFAQKRLYKDEADFIKRGGDDRRGYRAGYNSSHGPLRWFWYGDHELHVDIRFLDKIMSAYFSEFTVIDPSSMKEIYLDEARSLAGVMQIQGWTYEEATVISNDLHKEVQDAIDLRFPGASLDVTPRCRKALETISKWKWRVRDNDTHRAVYARLYEHARRGQTEDAPAAGMLWLQAVEHHRRYTLRQCPTGES